MLTDATMPPATHELEPMTPEEFRTWYDRLGLKQQDLAARLEVDQGTISRWLNGRREIPPFLWRALEHLATELEQERKPRRRRSADA
jgi:transcriptional regulator with XRE-family HTH domain